MVQMSSKMDLMMEACAIGNFHLVEDLLDQIKDINQVNPVNGWSCLHWATSRKNTDIVSLLLRNKADPQLKDKKGVSPYDLALKSKDTDLCSLFNIPLETALESVQDTNSCQSVFVPNYLKHPDLNKLWASADDYNFQNTNKQRTQIASDTNHSLKNDMLYDSDSKLSLENMDKKNINSEVYDSASHTKSVSFNIHLNEPSHIIGLHPILDHNETIQDTINNIFIEMDDLEGIQIDTAKFYWLHDTEKPVLIPINKKQFHRKTKDFCRWSSALVLDLLICIS